LDFNNCRGQGYDNGSNMRGRKQKCSSAYTSGKSTSIFYALWLPLSELCSWRFCNFLHRSCHIFQYYTARLHFFSASVGRWNILKDNVPTFTVKPLCNTSWECRIDCLKPRSYQIAEIHNAIVSVN
jgi:hypothetical protein